MPNRQATNENRTAMVRAPADSLRSKRVPATSLNETLGISASVERSGGFVVVCAEPTCFSLFVRNRGTAHPLEDVRREARVC